MANVFSSSSIIIQHAIVISNSANGVDKSNARLNRTETVIIQKPISKVETNINTLLEALNKELVKLKLQNVVVETTLDDSILVKSDLHDMRFYLELFVLAETPSLEYDIVINLYKNQKHILGTAGTVKNTFAKVKQFLK